jgi:hypothetical protein
MTSLPELNFPVFAAMTANLRAVGDTVTNPAELKPYGGSWNDCMRRDIATLMDCDTVATLPGWEHSKGARLELQIAERLGMTVVNAHDPVSPISTDQRLLSNKDCHIS